VKKRFVVNLIFSEWNHLGCVSEADGGSRLGVLQQGAWGEAAASFAKQDEVLENACGRLLQL
jgi:hypothetical protein